MEVQAPEDDEPVSAEELAELAEARQAIQDGQGVSIEDYRSDRLILEELSAELARLHKRLDALEPYLPLLHRWFAMRQALGKTLGGLRHG